MSRPSASACALHLTQLLSVCRHSRGKRRREENGSVTRIAQRCLPSDRVEDVVEQKRLEPINLACFGPEFGCLNRTPARINSRPAAAYLISRNAKCHQH